jgi:hypothetical protein
VASEVAFTIVRNEKSKIRQRRIHKNGDQIRAQSIDQVDNSQLYAEGEEIDQSRIEKDFLNQFEIGLKSFKTLKIGATLPIFMKMSREVIWVQIDSINNMKDDSSIFLNSHPSGASQALTFTNFDSFI